MRGVAHPSVREGSTLRERDQARAGVCGRETARERDQARAGVCERETAKRERERARAREREATVPKAIMYSDTETI